MTRLLLWLPYATPDQWASLIIAILLFMSALSGVGLQPMTAGL